MAKPICKIVKNWTYFVKGTHEKLIVPLRYVERKEYGQFITMFRVDLNEPIPLARENKDAAALQKEVFKELDAFYSIDWQPFFEVSAEHHQGTRCCNHHSEVSRTLIFTYRPVELGTRAADGAKVHRHPESNWLEKGWPEEGGKDRGTFNDDPVHEMVALVPNTPENKEKLDKIVAAMELLAGRMHDLLSPQKILTTLNNIHAVLPAPKEGAC